MSTSWQKVLFDFFLALHSNIRSVAQLKGGWFVKPFCCCFSFVTYMNYHFTSTNWKYLLNKIGSWKSDC